MRFPRMYKIGDRVKPARSFWSGNFTPSMHRAQQLYDGKKPWIVRIAWDRDYPCAELYGQQSLVLAGDPSCCTWPSGSFEPYDPELDVSRPLRTRAGRRVQEARRWSGGLVAQVYTESAGRIELHYDEWGYFYPGYECPVDLVSA